MRLRLTCLRCAPRPAYRAAMPDPQTKEIDGYTFRIPPMLGRAATRCATRLLRVLGGAGDAIRPGNEGETMAIAGVFKILRNLSDEDLDYFTTQMFASALVVTPEGKELPLNNPVHFDLVFQARVDMLFRALFFAIQINYPFLSAGLAKVATVLRSLPTRLSTSRPTSATSGPAGASSSTVS